MPGKLSGTVTYGLWRGAISGPKDSPANGDWRQRVMRVAAGAR